MFNSRITPGAIYRAVLLAFGLVVAGLVFRQLISLVLATLIVVIIALPLAAFAEWLKRWRIPRGLGATLGLLLGLGMLAGLIALIVPAFSHEINQFVNSLPSIVDAFRHKLGALTGTSPSHVGQQIQRFVNSYTHHPSKLLGPLESVGASVVAVLAAIVVILLTALYTAIRPDPLVNGLVRIVPPAGRPTAERILARLKEAYLGWIRGLFAGMIVLGGLTYIGLELVGLQFAAFFAVFTAIAMIIPYFGALVSAIPPIVFALTISSGKAIIVAIIYIAAHQLEGNVIQPLVVARAVKIHPAIIAIGVVAVDRLFGFIGLIIAVPIIATIKILVEELWINPLEQRKRAALVEPQDEPFTASAASTTVSSVIDGER